MVSLEVVGRGYVLKVEHEVFANKCGVAYDGNEVKTDSQSSLEQLEAL